MQLECPPHVGSLADFEIDPKFRRLGQVQLWRFVSKVDETVIRAYSMANYPEEEGIVKFNIGLPLPAPSRDDIPPGQMSSLGIQPRRATRSRSGPFGEFFARDTDNEMVFIGGGAGMAPMRSHIFDQLKRFAQQAQDHLLVRRTLDARSLLRRIRRKLPRTLTSRGILRSPTPARGQLDRLHGFHSQRSLRELPQGSPGTGRLRVLHVRSSDDELRSDQHAAGLGVERENILLDDFGG